MIIFTEISFSPETSSIKSLKLRKSAGTDIILNKMLKVGKDILVSQYTHSLTKFSQVVSIPKTGIQVY